jgi:hypothetical protein
MKPKSTRIEQQLPNHSDTLEAITLSQRLQACFKSIQDPRVERRRVHQLDDILTIAILSTIAGGEGWEDMETYGLNKVGCLHF